jgi:hypothetical protein
VETTVNAPVLLRLEVDLPKLKEVAHSVVRRAERQGSLLPREIREELARAGLGEKQWKHVVAQAKPALRFRQGRYYFQAPVSARLREQRRHHKTIHNHVRQLIRLYKKTHARSERRQQGRTDFVQPVKVRSEGREITLLSRNLSLAGICLVGTESLLGKKVHVLIPHAESPEPLDFLVRIVWTSTIGDGLFENGGTFLEFVEGQAEEQPLPSAESAE